MQYPKNTSSNVVLFVYVDDEIIFNIRKELQGNKTCVPGSYIIPKLEYGGVTTLELFQQYLLCIKKRDEKDRFWQTYRVETDKWIRMQLGINSIRSFPEEIATFLHLPEPQKFTSHSFRHTFATNLAEAGKKI